MNNFTGIFSTSIDDALSEIFFFADLVNRVITFLFVVLVLCVIFLAFPKFEAILSSVVPEYFFSVAQAWTRLALKLAAGASIVLSLFIPFSVIFVSILTEVRAQIVLKGNIALGSLDTSDELSKLNADIQKALSHFQGFGLIVLYLLSVICLLFSVFCFSQL